MVYANVFSTISSIIFYICLGVSVCLLAYGGIRRLIDIIRRKKRLKEDSKKEIEEYDEQERKKEIDKN